MTISHPASMLNYLRRLIDENKHSISRQIPMLQSKTVHQRKTNIEKLERWRGLHLGANLPMLPMLQATFSRCMVLVSHPIRRLTNGTIRKYRERWLLPNTARSNRSSNAPSRRPVRWSCPRSMCRKRQGTIRSLGWARARTIRSRAKPRQRPRGVQAS